MRVHRPLALRERPLGLADLHRRRELRRLPRRPARAHAAGDDRHRPERRDPDLARARADALARATTTCSAGSTCCRRWPRAAVHHGRSRAFAAGTPLDDVRASAEEFATGDFATFLVRGARCRARARAHARPARRLPRPPARARRACRGPRHDPSCSRASCSATSARCVGFYDATITGTDPFPDRRSRSAAPDPTLAGIGPAYTAAINRQLRSEIGVETDREYRLLSFEVNQAWKERRAAALLRAAGGRDRRLPLRHVAQPAHEGLHHARPLRPGRRRTTRATGCAT